MKSLVQVLLSVLFLQSHGETAFSSGSDCRENLNVTGSAVRIEGTQLTSNAAIYTSADETFKHKFEVLKHAKYSILISTFTIKPDAWYAHDEIGKSLADILIEKHRAGIEVKVFTDYWGNPPTTRAEIHRMIKAGVDIRFFGTPPYFFEFAKKSLKAIWTINLEKLSHAKVMVVDGWHVFTGGYNWMLGKSKHVQSWRDTDIYVSGPIAQKVSQEFYWVFDTLKKITKCTGTAKKIYDYSQVPQDFNDEFYLQAPWLRNGQTPINDKIAQLIDSAKAGDQIYWQSFSFRVQPPHLKALRGAAKRGVKITILSNSKENLVKQLFFIFEPLTRRVIANKLYREARQSYGPLLTLSSNNPAHLYEYSGPKGPMHAKAFLLLRRETSEALKIGQEPSIYIGEGGAGTYNASPNSWDKHIETMLFTTRPSIIRDLYQTYLWDIANSVEVIKGTSLN